MMLPVLLSTPKCMVFQTASYSPLLLLYCLAAVACPVPPRCAARAWAATASWAPPLMTAWGRPLTRRRASWASAPYQVGGTHPVGVQQLVVVLLVVKAVAARVFRHNLLCRVAWPHHPVGTGEPGAAATGYPCSYVCPCQTALGVSSQTLHHCYSPAASHHQAGHSWRRWQPLLTRRGVSPSRAVLPCR